MYSSDGFSRIPAFPSIPGNRESDEGRSNSKGQERTVTPKPLRYLRLRVFIGAGSPAAALPKTPIFPITGHDVLNLTFGVLRRFVAELLLRLR